MNASTSTSAGLAGRERDALNVLFAAPRIRTDERGVHTDDLGRRYDAVTVDGELTYRLAETAPSERRFAPVDAGAGFVAEAPDSDRGRCRLCGLAR